MPSADQVQQLLPLVREYGRLEKKRTQDAVTPREFERWAELRDRLEKKFPQGDRPDGGERRQNLRLPTRMLRPACPPTTAPATSSGRKSGRKGLV